MDSGVDRVKKLLFLGNPFKYLKGGAEYQYSILEHHLKEKFAIYYLFRYPTMATEKNYISYDYKFRKRYNPYLYTDVLTVHRLIRNLCPDIIYRRGVNYITAIGVHYAQSRKIKMVLHIASQRDVEVPKFNANIKTVFDFLNYYIGKYTIRNASRIVCQANYQNTLLQINHKRICDLVFPNMQPIPEEPINKQAKPIRIVWVANLKPLKQPELFIKLAEKFKNTQNTQFIMVGRPSSGTWQKRLSERINQLPNLEYRGEQSIEQVNKLLSESHILVNTSRFEGFSNTYIQAWMRRVPVVTLNADPDSMIETKGFGYHSRTFQQMVRDVGSLIKHHNLRENMGKNSQRFALKTFSTSNVEKLINLFGQL